MYNCPATNITAANVIANIALANCGTWFILPCAYTQRLRVVREAEVGAQSADSIKFRFGVRPRIAGVAKG
jgi:hypothetical protein